MILHIFLPIAQLMIKTTARWLVCPQNDHSHHLSAFAYSISRYHWTSKNMNMKLTSFDKTMIIAQLVADLNKNTISEHHLPSKRPQTAHFAYGRHYHCIWFKTITFWNGLCDICRIAYNMWQQQCMMTATASDRWLTGWMMPVTMITARMITATMMTATMMTATMMTAFYDDSNDDDSKDDDSTR